MASAVITGRRRPTKPKKQARGQKRKRDDVDVEKLSAAVQNLDPNLPVEDFTDLPLSEPTKAGLKASHFTKLTDIQRQAVLPALLGRDILGAARTGSGKTLAFLVPVLENLYRAQCVGPDAGLGAMVIAPTRELAIQIFDVLCNIGKHGHLFAAGLVIGGKSLREEQEALARMNIVVCTPGRILQHLSQTAAFAFGVDQLRMLVLDEADRIMDMGFQKDVDAIVEYLPPDRQTLLFSATQTKRVSDLARLSLRDPEYIAVHESAESATPASLQQNYTLVPLPQKLETLWSFLQSAKKSKILVFLASGKQVRYVFESFRKLQPGIPLMHLHGRQKQFARLEVTSRFSNSRAACLFSTDVAARGLDFPAVDWVVQVDCPEDADTYIHRVGRTARYNRDGRAVLFLDPSEEAGMLERLSHAKVPIERINVKASKLTQGGIGHQLASLCFQDPQLKYLGQKAFASYVRSLHVMKDTRVFELESYGDRIGRLAESMGLPGAPRIRFTKGDADAIKQRKNAPRRGMSPTSSDDEAGVVDGDASDADAAPARRGKAQWQDPPAVRTKYDRMFGRQNQDVLAPHFSAMLDAGDANDEDEDDLFRVKTRFVPDAPAPAPSSDAEEDPQSKLQGDSKRRKKAAQTRAGAAKLLAANVAGGLAGLAGASASKLVFDDATGEARAPSLFAADAPVAPAQRAAFVHSEAARLADADVRDREVERARRRAKREKRRARERGETVGEPNEPTEPNEPRQPASPSDPGALDEPGARNGYLEREASPLGLLAGLYSSDDGDEHDDGGDDEHHGGGAGSGGQHYRSTHGADPRGSIDGEDDPPEALAALESRAAALLA